MRQAESITISPINETRFISTLCDCLFNLGVGSQVVRAVCEEADGCAVAVCLVAPEIIETLTGETIPRYEAIFGQPIYDDIHAPVKSKMARLRQKLEEDGLL